MRRKTVITALAMAMLAGLTMVAAMAGEREVVGGVTILRGTSQSEENAAPAVGSSQPPETTVGNKVGNSTVTRVYTGDVGAGGEVFLPHSPAAGQ